MKSVIKLAWVLAAVFFTRLIVSSTRTVPSGLVDYRYTDVEQATENVGQGHLCFPQSPVRLYLKNPVLYGPYIEGQSTVIVRKYSMDMLNVHATFNLMSRQLNLGSYTSDPRILLRVYRIEDIDYTFVYEMEPADLVPLLRKKRQQDTKYEVLSVGVGVPLDPSWEDGLYRLVFVLDGTSDQHIVTQPNHRVSWSTGCATSTFRLHRTLTAEEKRRVESNSGCAIV